MPDSLLPTLSAEQMAAFRARRAAIVEAVQLELAAAIVRGDRLGATLIKRSHLRGATLRARAQSHIQAVAAGSSTTNAPAAARAWLATPGGALLARHTLANPFRPGGSGFGWGAGNPSGNPVVSERRARLMLRKMKCVRRTRRAGEIENGEDEMYVMGVKMDASALESAKVSPIDLGSWKDGQSRDYGASGKELFSVQFVAGQPFPTMAVGLLTFAERDPADGMLEFLEKLWDAVKDLAAEELQTWLDKHIGHDEEGMSPQEKSDFWVALLVQLIIQSIKELVAWLKMLTEDDVFAESPVHTESPVLLAIDGNWDADNRTSTTRYTVTQFGGEYHVDLFWQLK